ncbi:MAG: glycosidase [Candidatus Thiodiazotropha weberae]|uniref:Glycosidase n=1 Tax=Candidatus Thiodiazotropha endoloripes TaxID=1818881 RepID=A0A1E2UQ43_9GAMM|nr:glycosidase [Candidatus Thiodiazotropha endoloripes]MCG7897938.1 glycosidase [Candidatus Thiodiazotropha weberae]MCG7903806.1 glycosidase [Candidatus Thiodiazotropha weberae]MCG7912788.1 glycosidase [Candidatus Thiodiazotropha weberae]ODB85300.1 glycosidase [Candidatus Thiodiazotropha endoloripes]ODB96801.1 glycosidase [Candidatus Thiodiazotropha endoloripes]
MLEKSLPNGVMFNAYPDSIGFKLSDTITLLQNPELRDVFSLFYILPTFFQSDLDRGFSINRYELNDELVSEQDLQTLKEMNIVLKFDLVLNHLSVRSPQFLDILEKGFHSDYRDFFIDWNRFWEGEGEMGEDGCILPNEAHLNKLFMRKPELPILMVRFPDGSERPYWNTFYQQIHYRTLEADDINHFRMLPPEGIQTILAKFNARISAGKDFHDIDLGPYQDYLEQVVSIVESKRRYLGQMDLNAKSEVVWEFYEETLKRLADFGGKLIRLDAFAYLHKKPGLTNFFNVPGTWEYLDRLNTIAQAEQLTLLPEIHAQYGKHLHSAVAEAGYPIYDFFLPGLLLDALDQGRNAYLLRWIDEIQTQGIRTINMLGCHDGIPVLDLDGFETDSGYRAGLLEKADIEAIIERVLERGGRVKNLFGPDGKKIAYYQVNATYFSALGEDEQKLRLARAIQLFMPGIPQVWYLDLFAGKNDYAAADRGGPAGHKEINRTTLTSEMVATGLQSAVVLDQLEMMRHRNTATAFDGSLIIGDTPSDELEMIWTNDNDTTTLKASLNTHEFTISHSSADGGFQLYDYTKP